MLFYLLLSFGPKTNLFCRKYYKHILPLNNRLTQQLATIQNEDLRTSTRLQMDKLCISTILELNAETGYGSFHSSLLVINRYHRQEYLKEFEEITQRSQNLGALAEHLRVCKLRKWGIILKFASDLQKQIRTKAFRTTTGDSLFGKIFFNRE